MIRHNHIPGHQITDRIDGRFTVKINKSCHPDTHRKSKKLAFQISDCRSEISRLFYVERAARSLQSNAHLFGNGSDFVPQDF